jgi:hypothetical protein
VAESQTSSKKGLTRGKAILIGVLAVVLVTVLYLQFGRSGEKPVSEAVAYEPPRAAMSVEPVNSTARPVTLTITKTPSNAQAGEDKSAATAVLIDETRWKSPKLETIVAYDPFALPPAFPQPPQVGVGGKSTGAAGLIAAAKENDAKRLAEELEKLHMQLEELTQRGVQVIVRERGEYVAMIGDRLLHVGDKINEFTVTAIDPDGYVHVEMKESP